MKQITLDYTNVMDFISERELVDSIDNYDRARDKVINGTGEGSDFLGWLDLPDKIDENLVEDIVSTACQVNENSDVFISVGIGGSYLGARACIEAILPAFYNRRLKTEVYFAGNSLSPRYLNHLLALLIDKKITINVISKSGTTTETAVAFRIIRDWMVRNYGHDEAMKRIIVTTDAKKGALKQLADEEGLKSYVIPDDVGGRFSVLTPVGLVPIAVAGIDLHELLKGAREGVAEFQDVADIYKNPASMYAVIRNILYNRGKTVEILASFEPQLHYFAEWWKQLFGESEGKQNRGIFPASVDFTTDLHSMGQWIQQGRRDIFETFINVEDPESEIKIPEDEKNLDNLNYLADQPLSYVNHQALLGTRAAHREGGVPNMTVNIPNLNPHCIGKLFYFFEWAVAVSGYMLGVNPFNQPGVEDYKKNMFALLGKPGYEKQQKTLKETLAAEKKYIAAIHDKKS